MSVNDLLFAGIALENWQMMDWEKIALIGVLAQIKPKNSLEIGVYFGGSLSLTSQFVDKIYAIDIDPAVLERFKVPDNAEIIIGDSSNEIPALFSRLTEEKRALNFILIDADHTSEGVRRDIEAVLEYTPREPLVILIHDAGNPACRKGIIEAEWEKNSYVHFLELDFVPAQIIESTVKENSAEIWGGFALAYLDGNPRKSDFYISSAAKTGHLGLKYMCSNLKKVIEGV